ncbi:hypothetical protein K9M48_01750 [Candidatus Gracilibacteria bacterium]|nr:hypothetical protein [Candidatus Gracilibacteria bacterium]
MSLYTKFIIFFLSLGFIISNQSFSELLNTNISGSTETKTITETIEFDDNGNGNVIDKVQRVQNYFCNKGYNSIDDLETNLVMDAKSGEEKEICLIFANKNLEKVNIILGLTDGRKNEAGAISCNTNLTGKNYLSDLLINKQNSDFVFSLMPNEQILKKFLIRIPKTQTGNIIGCTVFKIKENIQKAKTGKIFNIEIAKKATIEINITGSVYNNQRLEDIKYGIKDNKDLILKILIGIIGLRLLVSIIEQIKKKKHHKKK